MSVSAASDNVPVNRRRAVLAGTVGTRSSGTTSSSTARPRRWSSRRCSSPVEHLRGRARCRSRPCSSGSPPARRRSDLRPLRRPDRAQGHADHDAAAHGRRDGVLIGLLPGYVPIGIAAPILVTLRAAAGHRRRRRVGRLGPAPRMEWGESQARAASWPAGRSSGVPIGLLLSTAMVRDVAADRRRLRRPGAGGSRSCSASSVGVGLYVRLRVAREAEFRGGQEDSGRWSSAPLVEVIKRH